MSRPIPPTGTSPAALAYRAVTSVAGALIPLVARGGDWAERLGKEGPQLGEAGIWVHAASVGELNSAKVLIEDLAADLPLLVTTNSVTGRALARDWGLQACLAPLDVTAALQRFLNRNRPRIAVTIENEIWPNRARMLAARGISQVVVGARMSQRSAARWGRLPGLIGPVLSGVDLLSAQDHHTEQRLLDLGLHRDALAPILQLKLLAPARIEPGLPGKWRAATVLAASTHEGEDALILDAFLTARSKGPDLRLILAPRHPRRGDEVLALMQARGLVVARRSLGADETAPILLADTLGEMPRWYDSAAICVTGGSFTDRGGHTPWEPAAHSCAILHGPHVANFAADYAALDAAGASLGTDADGLAAALGNLVGDGARVAAMGAAARALLLSRAGDPAPLLKAIRALAAGQPCASRVE